MRRLLALVLFAAFALAPAVQAAPITYKVVLTGAQEVPAVDTPGTGSAVITYDPLSHLLSLDVSFANLIGTTTASHIHCCTATPFAGTAGVATQVPTFLDFPLGVHSGTYIHTFDLSLPGSWNPAFITANGGTVGAAESVFATGLADGRAYLNIHSSFRTGGEIRGFLVPEPGTAALVLLGAAGLAVARRRARA
jgi:hypothetical protein